MGGKSENRILGSRMSLSKKCPPLGLLDVNLLPILSNQVCHTGCPGSARFWCALVIEKRKSRDAIANGTIPTRRGVAIISLKKDTLNKTLKKRLDDLG